MFLWKLNLKILARYKRSKWVRSLCGFAATRWFSVFKCHIGYSLVLFFFFLTGEIPLQNKKIKNKKGSHMRQNVSCRYKAKRSQAAQCVPQPKGPGPAPLSPCAGCLSCPLQETTPGEGGSAGMESIMGVRMGTGCVKLPHGIAPVCPLHKLLLDGQLCLDSTWAGIVPIAFNVMIGTAKWQLCSDLKSVQALGFSGSLMLLR